MQWNGPAVSSVTSRERNKPLSTSVDSSQASLTDKDRLIGILRNEAWHWAKWLARVFPIAVVVFLCPIPGLNIDTPHFRIGIITAITVGLIVNDASSTALSKSSAIIGKSMTTSASVLSDSLSSIGTGIGLGLIAIALAHVIAHSTDRPTLTKVSLA
jgi:hypothetical protein